MGNWAWHHNEVIDTYQVLGVVWHSMDIGKSLVDLYSSKNCPNINYLSKNGYY